MPDDNPPISTTVPETTTIDTGADPESIATLKASFEDFWKDQDQGQPEPKAPAAPGPAQETKPVKEAAPPATEKVEAKVERVIQPREKSPVAESPKEYTDDEIDAITLIPGQRPEIYDQFKSVKDKWKADRALLRTQEERHKAIEAQLAEARVNQLTPELKADYEHAAGIRRRVDFFSDPEFQNKFQVPLIKQYHDILDEAGSMLDDPREGARWAAEVKANWQTPDTLGDTMEKQRQWWSYSVIAKIPDPMNQQQIIAQVNKLYGMQKDRNAELYKHTSDQGSYDNLIKERKANTDKWTQDEIVAESKVQEARFKEYLPRDVSSAKTKEERAAIEEHNDRFQKLNQIFINTLQDQLTNGPKAWVRAAVETARTQLALSENAQLAERNKYLEGEVARLQTDLDKIMGARRKLAQTSGTTPTPTGTKASQNGQGLSLSDLDVRKSFRNFDWGDGSK